ncbi:hypothetical protein INP83_15905 [Mucilaginibacter sp. 21P]|uniref:hypothetical protein n=1 Tax=Mucilaginibacter sp. 21P TaxID=2778902 RepID=UPI001C565369|nr:hypothetical protein [Mucilaginibacter sp. 21P]QXV64564.1 hypothetical protein INP83_15905 [Mucilaginibacter sp. 21P]
MKIVLSFLFVLFVYNAFAQTPQGCIIVYPYGTVPAYPNVYGTLLTGVSVPTTQAADIQGKPVYNGNISSPPGNYACYINPNPTSKRECAVRGGTSSSNYVWYGGVFAQNYYKCPIDDYLFLLMLPIIGLGLYFLRKRQIIF